VEAKKILFVEILLMVFLVVGYFAGDIWNYFSKKELIYTNADKNCSLNLNACELILQDGSSLSLEIVPKDIYPLQKTEFVSKAEGADSVRMTILSTSMNMGAHEYAFKKENDGLFHATILLPACSAKMKWQADVKVERKNKRYGGGFLFESKN
jgi:hypothetical protein